MTAREQHGRPKPAPDSQGATFELERFAWGAPDRLELSGRFVGLTGPPADAAELVVRGAERTHRLPPVRGGEPGTPEDGGLWRAEFEWKEAPEACDAVQLQLGGDIAVDLPAPGDVQQQSLEVRYQRPEDRAAEPSQAVAPAAEAKRLRLEAELLAAREEVTELRVALERAREELDRASADLDAERQRHAADAARFREGLARVQESAEAALTEANDAVQARDAAQQELQAELDAAAAAREDLSAELDAAAAARTRAEHDAQALRERLDAVEGARSVAEDAAADAERMLARLTTIREAFGDRD